MSDKSESTIMMSYADMARMADIIWSLKMASRATIGSKTGTRPCKRHMEQRPVLTVLALVVQVWARFLKGAAFGVLLCVPAISVLVLILWLESVYGK